MQQAFQKPENALKRADELQLIGQPEAALKVLHQAIGHKRFRAAGWDSIQEQILLRYGELCVDLEKIKLAREGLHQYRSISQQTNVASLGKVIGDLRDRAEKRVREAKEKVDVELKVDDLEAGESPESLMLSTLQIEVRDSQGRKLHAALRFVWETYKMILDVLRTTPKLERVYHDTALKAFQFCRENERSQEFKRLCEVLKTHYKILLLNRHKPDSEGLLRPDLHLETRLSQLCVAADLRLWKEACNTAEDIFSLGIHDLFHRAFRSNAEPFYKAREKLLKWLATYYEKMAKILWVSDNHLYHALACIKYLLHIKQFKKNVPLAHMRDLCSAAVLSVLAIPVTPEREKRLDAVGNEVGVMSVENQKRMTAMLGHPTVPNRDFLKTTLMSKDIIAGASPECQKLYSLLETDFTPLRLCTECQPLLAALEGSQYVYALKKVIFHKLILQLSKVYNSICVDYFTTHICSKDFLPWAEAEKVVVSLVQQGQIQMRLDYVKKALYFGAASIDPAVTMRYQLANVAKQLDETVRRLGVQEERKRIDDASAFVEKLEVEHLRVKQRNLENEQRRQEKQAEQQKAEEQRKKLAEQQRVLEENLEVRRREEALKRREDKRVREEKNRVKSETAQQMLEEIRKLGNKVTIKGKQLDEINVEDVLEGTVIYEDIEKAQDEQRNRERIERVRQRRAEAKRMDHYIRACREEELPVLELWQSQVHEADTKVLRELQSKHEEEHKAAFKEALNEKQMFEYVVPFKQDWIASRMEARRQEYESARAEQTERLMEHLKAAKKQRALERRNAKKKEEAYMREEKRALEEFESKNAESANAEQQQKGSPS